MLKFYKYQGTSNDFLIIEDLEKRLEFLPQFVARLCHRNLGVGAGGVIVVRPSKTADYFFDFYNVEGTPAEMCGNGIRCFARYLYDKKLISGNQFSIETVSGIRHVQILAGEEATNVRVDMGKANFSGPAIPVAEEHGEVLDKIIELDGRDFKVSCVSIGNPHCILYVDDVGYAPVREVGPKLEFHPAFPERINVEFVEVVNASKIKVRTWERAGEGECPACGTGATASAACTIRQNLTQKKVMVHMPGGILTIEMNKAGHLFMTGDAEIVFEGILSPAWEKRFRLKV